MQNPVIEATIKEQVKKEDDENSSTSSDNMFSSLLKRDGWRNLSKTVTRKDRSSKSGSVVSDQRASLLTGNESIIRSAIAGLDSKNIAQSVQIEMKAAARADLDLSNQIVNTEMTPAPQRKVPPLNFSMLPNH